MIKIRYSIDNSMNLFQFDLFNDINSFLTLYGTWMSSRRNSELKNEFSLKTMLQENVINLDIFLEMVENHKEENREIH